MKRCDEAAVDARVRRAPMRAQRRFAIGLALFSGLLSVESAQAQDFDCSAVLTESARDWGRGTDPATVFERYIPRNPRIFSSVGGRVQMYVPTYWRTSPHPEAPRDTPEIMAEAIRKTIEQLNPHHPPMPICAVLSPGVAGQATDHWDWDSLAETGRYGGVCELVVHITAVLPVGDDSGLRAGRQNVGDFQTSVAHEVYHCYQEQYFRAQSTRQVFDSASWWVESSAEFVANQIYPCGLTTRLFARWYDPAKRLFDQHDGYPNVLFFQHLGEKFRFDFGQLKAFSLAMPTQPGISRQQEALAARPGIAGQLHSFAQAYTDGAFSACIAPNLNQGVIPETRITANQRIPMSVQPFAFARHKIVLPEDATYEISVRTSDRRGTGGLNDPDRVSYRDANNPGHWTSGGAPNFSITTQCGETKSYLFLATSAQPRDTRFQLEIDIERKQEKMSESIGCCVDTGQRDRCIVGTWTMDKDYMLQQLRRLNPKMQYNPIRGEARVTYRADGTTSGTASQMQVGGTADLNIGKAPIKVDMAGQGSGNWSTRDGVLYVCPKRERSSVEKEIKWPHGPVEKGAVQFPVPQGISFPYRCSSNTLELDLPGYDGPRLRGMKPGRTLTRMKQRYKRVQ